MAYQSGLSLSTINLGVSNILTDLERKGVEMELFQFSDHVEAVDRNSELNGQGSLTDFGALLNHLQENSLKMSGAILISDGQITYGKEVLKNNISLKIPVYAIGVGDTNKMVDVLITSVDIPAYTFLDEPFTAEVAVSAHGVAPKRFSLAVYDGNGLVGSRNVELSGDGSERFVTFTIEPVRLGVNDYRVQISSLTEEINIQNNQHQFSITALKDRYKVALLTGAPNFNTSLLKRNIREQYRFHVDHFIQYQQEFKPPLKEFWEMSYDLIIFDNFPTEPVSNQWLRIFRRKQFSQKSALAWFIGPHVTQSSAESIFPIFNFIGSDNILESGEVVGWYFTNELKATLDRDFNQISNEYDVSPDDESDLPPLAVGLQLSNLSDQFIQLAAMSYPFRLPIWIVNENEDNRQSVWTTPDLYKIHYQSGGNPKQGMLSELLSSLIHWLVRDSGENNLHFRLNKNSFQQGETIIVTGKREGVNDPSAEVSIALYKEEKLIKGSQLRFHNQRNRWEGKLWASSPGNYRFEIVYAGDGNLFTQFGDFVVQESQIELNNVILNRSTLTQLTESTGGKMFVWDLRSELEDLIEPYSTQVVNRIVIDLNRHWLVLILMLGLLTVEWGYRRKLGLL
ncbi:MAG: vWA domain-containing protein [Candidatus Neomarinimicrobiota bacterium]